MYEAARTGKVVALKRTQEAIVPLRAALGHLRVDQITQARWDTYATQRLTKPPRRGDPAKHVPRPVAPGTLRREFNTFRAAMNLAWLGGFLPRPLALEAPGDSAPRDRYLTKHEARSLIAAAETPHVRLFVALAIYTGARKGSILALTWDRVDLASGIIEFQEPGRKLTSKRRATVPMNDSLRRELEAAKEVATTDFVVEYNGNPVPFGLRWSWQRLCQRAKLKWRPTPHHLKHSVASWLAMEGVPIDQAADWLATDPTTLRKVYRKFDPAYLRSVAGALEL
jgi:integrase